jgi:uncharacterized protein (DUF736 family)
MAVIGSFTKDATGFTGTVRTLSINAKARFTPAESGTEKAPDFRVTPAPAGAVSSIDARGHGPRP